MAPPTKHYKSLGLRPYFKDPEYSSHIVCVSHIMYDLLIWVRNTGGNDGDIVTALRMAHEKVLEWHLDALKWVENIMEKTDADVG